MIKNLLKVFKNKPKEIILNYWKNPDLNNSPKSYLDNDITLERSEYLLQIIKNHFDNNIKILELGSNVGRNLNYLYKNNFKNLTGIEINENAIKIMQEYYKECYNNSKILVGAIEDYIKNFKDNEFDLIFTMAVLEHIHKDSEWIFDEMIRISKFIITIEDEKSLSWRHFPRKYDKIFSKKMKQIESEDCSFIKGFNQGFIMRIFQK